MLVSEYKRAACGRFQFYRTSGFHFGFIDKFSRRRITVNKIIGVYDLSINQSQDATKAIVRNLVYPYVRHITGFLPGQYLEGPSQYSP